MTLRIDISEVGDRIEEAIAVAATGEEVVLERDGRAVAQIKPSEPPNRGIRAMFEELERTGPRGPEAVERWEAFELDLAYARSLINHPIDDRDPWSSERFEHLPGVDRSEASR